MSAITPHRLTVVLTAIAVFVVGMLGGGFDLPERHIIGIVTWLFVLGTLPFVARPARPVVLIAGLLAGLTLLTGLSSLWSESAQLSVFETTRVFAYLGLFLVGASIAQLAGRRPVVMGITLGVAGLLLMAVLSRLEPGLFPAQDLQAAAPDVRPRLTYPLDYWNGVAALAAIAVPLFLYQATRPELGPRLRALWAAAMPLTGLTLYLTFSRGGLAAATLAAALFVIASPTRMNALKSLALSALLTLPIVVLVNSYRALNDGLLDSDAARSQGHRVLVLLIVVCVAIWLLNPLLERASFDWRPRLPQVRTRAAGTAAIVVLASLALAAVALGDVGGRWESFRSGKDGGGEIEGRYLSVSGNGRYEYWSAAVDEWQTKPVFGRGAGTWELWWTRHATIDAFVRDSHSLVFDTIGELGITGLLLVVGIFVAVIWLAVAGVRHRYGDERALAAALLGVLAAFALSASIDWVWEIPALAGLFFVVAGLVAADRAGRGEERKPAEAPRRWAIGAPAAAAIALVAGAAIVLQALVLASTLELRSSQSAVRDGDLDKAIDRADRARSLQPWSAEPKVQLALSQRMSKDYESAIVWARDAVRQEPTNWRNWIVLANIENDVGLKDDYARHLEIARRLSPRSRYWQSIGFPLPPDQLPR